VVAGRAVGDGPRLVAADIYDSYASGRHSLPLVCLWIMIESVK